MLYTTLYSSLLGEMILGVRDQGVCLVEFTDGKGIVKKLAKLEQRYNVVTDQSHRYLEQLQIELDEYFTGIRQNFSVPLDFSGTLFQTQVWQTLLTIHFGETISYLQQAIRMKKPLAVRAVASSNGKNNISIIVPCHRVIGSNGKLTGYAGGLWRKEWLLNHERDVMLAGKKY